MSIKVKDFKKVAKEQYNKGRESAFKEIAYADGLKESEYEKRVRADERAKVLEKCAKVIATQLPNICTTSCPVKCEWGTDETCADYWEKYLLEQLKESEE